MSQGLLRTLTAYKSTRTQAVLLNVSDIVLSNGFVKFSTALFEINMIYEHMTAQDCIVSKVSSNAVMLDLFRIWQTLSPKVCKRTDTKGYCEIIQYKYQAQISCPCPLELTRCVSYSNASSFQRWWGYTGLIKCISKKKMEIQKIL